MQICSFRFRGRHRENFQREDTPSSPENIKLPSPIQNLEFAHDDQGLAAGCSNGQIFLLDYNYKPCASLMVSNSPTLSTMACSKLTPNLLAGANKEGMLSLWNTDTIDTIFSIKKHNGRITDLAFFDNILSSVGSDGRYVSYDLRSSKCICNYELDSSLQSSPSTGNE
ncbi:hypothetical protein JTB14_027428 [Gonioctena quinquepunctata]|nr:hypothetical protein JTB14_027428 [Gonioctena quinquepunctata]